MKKLRLISLLPALFTVSQTLACGDTEGKIETTDAGSSDQTTADSAEAYEFSRKWAGQELHILNPYDIYSMHSQLDRETITGEALDDAFYNRCRRLESEMGITLVEDNTYKISNEVNEFAQKMIMSNDDTYDVMYISTNGVYPIVKSNGLTELKSLEGLRLDKEWWQGGFSEKLEMNGSLYSAVGSAHLMYIDSLWGLFFNEDMMNDLKLELPYELVREGKWTTDGIRSLARRLCLDNCRESECHRGSTRKDKFLSS